jgi:hypothetical protein
VSLSDGAGTSVTTAAPDADASSAADPVGTCFSFGDDDRTDAADGSMYWATVDCSSPHTGDVVAHLDDPGGAGIDPQSWDRDDLEAVHDACADAVAALADTVQLGANPVVSPAPRDDTVMCVVTSDEHRDTTTASSTTLGGSDEGTADDGGS